MYKLAILVLALGFTLNLFGAQISDERDPEDFSLKKNNNALDHTISGYLKQTRQPVIADNWMVVTANAQASKAAANASAKHLP